VTLVAYGRTNKFTRDDKPRLIGMTHIDETARAAHDVTNVAVSLHFAMSVTNKKEP
jgi:hypothetical protein